MNKHIGRLKISSNEEYEELLEESKWAHGMAGILENVLPPGERRNYCDSYTLL